MARILFALEPTGTPCREAEAPEGAGGRAHASTELPAAGWATVVQTRYGRVHCLVGVRHVPGAVPRAGSTCPHPDSLDPDSLGPALRGSWGALTPQAGAELSQQN